MCSHSFATSKSVHGVGSWDCWAVTPSSTVARSVRTRASESAVSLMVVDAVVSWEVVSWEVVSWAVMPWTVRATTPPRLKIRVRVRLYTVDMDVAPEPVERDSRGILDPGLLRRHVRLTRYPATPPLRAVVDRVCVVRWALPPELVRAHAGPTPPRAD